MFGIVLITFLSVPIIFSIKPMLIPAAIDKTIVFSDKSSFILSSTFGTIFGFTERMRISLSFASSFSFSAFFTSYSFDNSSIFSLFKSKIAIFLFSRKFEDVTPFNIELPIFPAPIIPNFIQFCSLL